MNRLLKYQLKRHYGKEFKLESFDLNLQNIFKDISSSYDTYEKDKKLVEHVLKINSDELYKSNRELESKIETEIEKHKVTQALLQSQSRMAQMGEMISMIAHQWRQPLSSIASVSIDLNIKSVLDVYDLGKKEEALEYEKVINNGLDNINELVQNLTTTIDDFRNFYKPDKKTVEVRLEELVSKSLNLIKALLISENIEVIQKNTSKNTIKVYDNELMQVIINILKNAQDNFKEKEIQNPYLKIITEDKVISITDNGGGISDDIIEKIFDPYFSTKKAKNGTGLGLYMSKIIIEEHHKGKLLVENKDEGVCFSIDLSE